MVDHRLHRSRIVAPDAHPPDRRTRRARHAPSAGAFPGGRIKSHEDAAEAKRAAPAHSFSPDGKLTFSKLDAVFKSGNATRDDIPSHLIVGKDIPPDVAELYTHMCPAGVYEVPEDAPEDGDVDVIVNYTNCVQCGAITAKGGRLTPPEGGDGPLYTIT